MEDDWILLNTYTQPNSAHVAKSLLEDHGIRVVLINKQDSSYPVFGQLELFCHVEEAVKAMEILETNDHE